MAQIFAQEFQPLEQKWSTSITPKNSIVPERDKGTIKSRTPSVTPKQMDGSINFEGMA